MAKAERGYIEVRRPETCGNCRFLTDVFDDEELITDEGESLYEACGLPVNGEAFRRLCKEDYKNGRYTIPKRCGLKPVKGARFRARLVVDWPSSCRDCVLFSPEEEGDEIERYYCFADAVLKTEREASACEPAEALFNHEIGGRRLTEGEFKAKARPGWCPLKRCEK